jgi:hypothetical protein
MSTSADLAARSTSLLTVQLGASAWAIPSSAVLSVESVSEGEREPIDAPDALALLGLEARGGESARRVMVVRARGEQARLLIRGTLGLREATPQELVPLPSELAASAPLVSHVAVLDGKPALFVVSPERLLRASRNTVTPTPNETDAARGSSC